MRQREEERGRGSGLPARSQPRGVNNRRYLLLAALALVAGMLLRALAVSEPGAQRSPAPLLGAPARSAAPLRPMPAGRLGLHVSAQELEIWRQRAQDGPYRTQGDVSVNSPGDWERITMGAGLFLADPAAARWQGPQENNPGGCVIRGERRRQTDTDYQPPIDPATALRDAAFFSLIQGSEQHARAVKAELMAQVSEPGVNFADRDRWCLGEIMDGTPGFTTASWLTKLLYAADYLEIRDPGTFTPEERAQLDGWFWHAADWMRHDTDVKLNELFVDRPGGDFTLTDAARASDRDDQVVFLGGPKVYRLHASFNNRNARQARFVTLVGIDQNDQGFIHHGKNYVKDALRFSYFPSGATGDFERWERSDPIKGWKYGTEVGGALLSVADHLARTGDMELYEFGTAQGALGTEGQHNTGVNKSLATLTADLARYVDHTYVRYGTDKPEEATGTEYLIDSVNDLDNEARINDTFLSVAARYRPDPYVESVYLRTAPGTPPYPDDPARGIGDPESGEAGVYPGVLFMFAQMPPAG